MNAPAPLRFEGAALDEEIARAELYGLLARLWLAAPDEALLQQFATAVTQAVEPGGHLEAPWQALVAAMRASNTIDAAEEYEALFMGVGKAEVFVYASYHLAGFLHEAPLARLREDLHPLGLTRDTARGETEDHVAYIFEVMRYLIAGDDAAASAAAGKLAGGGNLEQQRRFFRAHVQSWVDKLCDAVLAHPRARLWRDVATFTAAFVQVEAQGFDLLEQ